MRKTIHDGLKARDCRWVYDTSPATFCCAPTLPGKSYCPEHAEIVYVPNQRPKVRRPTSLPINTIASAKHEEATEPRVDLVEVMAPESYNG